jgi:hypothetical protein
MNIELLGFKLSLEVLILMGIIYLVIIVNTLHGCCNMEGFVGANTNYGESSQFSLTNDKVVNPDSWSMPNLTIVQGQPAGLGVQNILNRPAQPIPLPKGEMLMFANTPFKPECCPNTYSTSMGCACMTVKQYNYLNNRGGNNVPYSEY